MPQVMPEGMSNVPHRSPSSAVRRSRIYAELSVGGEDLLQDPYSSDSHHSFERRGAASIKPPLMAYFRGTLPRALRVRSPPTARTARSRDGAPVRAPRPRCLRPEPSGTHAPCRTLVQSRRRHTGTAREAAVAALRWAPPPGTRARQKEQRGSVSWSSSFLGPASGAGRRCSSVIPSAAPR